jgi:hypothetical protein
LRHDYKEENARPRVDEKYDETEGNRSTDKNVNQSDAFLCLRRIKVWADMVHVIGASAAAEKISTGHCFRQVRGQSTHENDILVKKMSHRSG